MNAECQDHARLSEVGQCSPQDLLKSLVPWCIGVEEHLCSSSFVTTWSKTFFDDADHVLNLSNVVAKMKFICKFGGDRKTNLVIVKAKNLALLPKILQVNAQQLVPRRLLHVGR